MAVAAAERWWWLPVSCAEWLTERIDPLAGYAHPDAQHAALPVGDDCMIEVVFYEKPGCTNNKRQKQWLEQHGVTVKALDLLAYPWSNDELLAFFGALPVSEWFNLSAPRVKSGEVMPEQLTQQQALQLLLDEPLMIRRPLLCKGLARRVGFDSAAIAEWLGLRCDNEASVLSENCPRPARPCIAGENEA